MKRERKRERENFDFKNRNEKIKMFQGKEYFKMDRYLFNHILMI